MNSSQKREFLDLITIENAKKLIFESFNWSPSIESIPLEEAKDRILAEDVTARIDIPPFDRSRMDGFAVNSEDTYLIDETNPKVFQIIDSIQAGQVSKTELSKQFTCIEIATGAVIPQGTNAIVMIEYSSRINEKEVEIYRAVTPQENVEAAGSDIMYGETVLRTGYSLTPVRLGILAALGISEVKVNTKLKIAILSSGDELRKPGEFLPEGCIYDTNSIILANLVLEAGATSVELGICPDDLEILKNTLYKHLSKFDILLISGGTSAGEGDYSYRVISELGGKLLFHGVSSKPGKPLAVGVIDKKLIVTLPGFPASAIFSFNTVIAPLLHQWTKIPFQDQYTIQAQVSQKIRNFTGRTQFKLVYLLKDESYFRIYPVKGTSGSISALERADGYITIPENVDIIDTGSIIDVNLLRKNLLIPHLIFIGSHDFVIDQLFREFSAKCPEFNAKLIFTGSTGGISALTRGECDIAGSHLLDDETNQYNVPFIKKAQLDDDVILIDGYKRLQGLYVAKGNPKGINGIKDLLRSDITFLNRNAGSGTRLLIDSLLYDLSKQLNYQMDDVQKQIKGYSSIASSHSATSGAISRGIVDVSIGIEPYTQKFDIDFIPLTEERYDLIIKKSRSKNPAMIKLLDIFHSDDFRTKIKKDIQGVVWLNESQK